MSSAHVPARVRRISCVSLAVNSSPALIVIAGVEGGGVTLYGERSGAGWRFWVERVDQSRVYLDEYDDEAGSRRQSGIVSSWEDALRLLDRAGWMRLPAVRVHPEFRQKVWQAVQARLGTTPESTRWLPRWRDRCDIDG